jgi:uncharacterized protein involved in outer membrane biogenesis
MKKAYRAAFAAALVLLAIGVGVVSLSLGTIVKTAVTAAGPRMLGAPVELGLVTISPWSGRGTLRDLVIGNPEGFKSPRAVRVGAIEVTVKLSSLLTDTIVVESLAVREPELTWEIGQGGSNLTRLQENAQAAAAKFGGGSSPAAAAPSKPGKSLLIMDFTVTGGKVGLSANAFGGEGLSAPLPDVHLTNLGGKGRSPAEAAAEAFRAITNSAQGAVAGIGSKAIDAVRGAAFSALSSFFKKGGK